MIVSLLSIHLGSILSALVIFGLGSFLILTVSLRYINTIDWEKEISIEIFNVLEKPNTDDTLTQPVII